MPRKQFDTKTSPKIKKSHTQYLFCYTSSMSHFKSIEKCVHILTLWISPIVTLYQDLTYLYTYIGVGCPHTFFLMCFTFFFILNKNDKAKLKKKIYIQED